MDGPGRSVVEDLRRPHGSDAVSAVSGETSPGVVVGGSVREAGARTWLGELERAVLDHLWVAGPASVKAVHSAVGAPRRISPKTVHSALERLVRKGLVQRRKLGRAHEYAALLSRREWMARRLGGLAGEVPGTPPETLLAAFVDLTERAGAEHLAELERLVRERRRRRERSS